MGRERLAVFADVARQLRAEEIARDAEAVAARVAESRFYVAFVGQFKRGKSTLINALLGSPVLPTGVVPVTNLVTIVRHGEQSIVRLANGEERQISVGELSDYVSEERNPNNCKHVTVAEVRMPAAMLAGGMCLVDTPGIGSVFGSNSDVTRRFVPHIDVAVLVVGADPPLSGEEAALAGEVSRETPHVFVVLNKADRMSDDDVRQAAAFTRKTLEGRLGRAIDLFVVSAVQRGTRDWTALEDRLAQLAREEGRDLVQLASERAARRIRAMLLYEIAEHRHALEVPIAETEQSLLEKRRRVADAQRALDDLTFLFASEQQKLARQLAAKRDRFLSQVALTADDEDTARRAAMAAIESWVAELEPEAQRMFAASTERFSALLRDLGGPPLERDLSRRRFYFTALPELTGHRLFRKQDPQTYLRRLLETNSARVINDGVDRFVESRRQLEREVASSLREIAAAAERAARRASEALTSGQESIAAELDRLDALAARISC